MDPPPEPPEPLVDGPPDEDAIVLEVPPLPTAVSGPP
jgi:hypothetical protein